MKKLAIYALVVVATLGALYLVYIFRAVVLLFLLSLFIAAAVRPIISRLTSRGLPPGAAIIVTYVAAILFVGLWLYVVGRIALLEFEQLVNQLAIRYQAVRPGWEEGTTLQQFLASRLPPPENLFDALTREEGTLLAQALFTLVRSIVSFLAALAIMIVLSVYWSLDRLHFERLWLSVIPAGSRNRGRTVWHAVEKGVGTYLRNQLIQTFIAVILLGGGYYVLGITYPVLLALLGAVAWLIPVVGFIFAALAALLVGLVSSPIIGALAAVYTVVVFVALGELVERTLLKHRGNYSYLLVVLLMIPLAETYGFFGLLAAPPLAVSIESLLGMIFGQRRDGLASDDPQTRLIELNNKLHSLQKRAAENGTVAPEMASLIERLDRLMTRTGAAIRGNYPRP